MGQHLQENSSKPGAIALALMGWLDMAVSLFIYFVYDLDAAALFFATTSIMLGFIARQVQKRRLWYDQGMATAESETPNPARNMLFTALIIAVGGGLVFVAVLAWTNGAPVKAILFGLWAIAGTMLINRLR